jgi:hypothetical protein
MQQLYNISNFDTYSELVLAAEQDLSAAPYLG